MRFWIFFENLCYKFEFFEYFCNFFKNWQFIGFLQIFAIIKNRRFFTILNFFEDFWNFQKFEQFVNFKDFHQFLKNRRYLKIENLQFFGFLNFFEFSCDFCCSIVLMLESSLPFPFLAFASFTTSRKGAEQVGWCASEIKVREEGVHIYKLLGPSEYYSRSKTLIHVFFVKSVWDYNYHNYRYRDQPISRRYHGCLYCTSKIK